MVLYFPYLVPVSLYVSRVNNIYIEIYIYILYIYIYYIYILLTLVCMYNFVYDMCYVATV